MKYKQLVIGFVLGILVSYGAYRVEHHIRRAGGLTAAGLTIGQPARADQNDGNQINFSKFDLSTSTNLGQVTFNYDFVPEDGSGDAAMQLFLPVAGSWQQFTPTDANGTLVFHLQQDTDCTGHFSIDLPKGTYTSYRIILFNCPDGKNADFNHALYDTTNDKILTLPKLNFTITSDTAPVGAPTIIVSKNITSQDEGNGLYQVTIPATVTYASNIQPDGGGFWVMAKGDAGFAQVYVSSSDAVPDPNQQGQALDIPVNLVIKDVKPGLWNVQVGLFKPNWGNPIKWIFPGPYFEAGGSSWESLAPQVVVPPRLQVVDRKFELLTGTPYDFYRDDVNGKSAVNFVRGGNYGNAINWTYRPMLDTPSYFGALASKGCHYIRFNYNPDLYLDEPGYQDAVDQVVQNIWSAGLYPIIAPQDLPSGTSLAERIERGNKLMSLVARRYSGRSIWLEVCNEPHEFNSWGAWKGVAVQYVKTIRAVDPNAFVIVPFEGYSKDGRGAAENPITETHVDLYDGHAYVGASDVAQDFEPAIQAGLPVLIGEYGGADPAYLHSMDNAFQNLPIQPLGISPWAFTVAGQDTLPLVQNGDRSTLTFTPAGQSIVDDFGAWDSGRKLQ